MTTSRDVLSIIKNLNNNFAAKNHSHTSANISDATNVNTANMIVKRDSSGNFSAGTITAALSGNATTATKLATARTITLTGTATGSFSFDGSGAVNVSTVLENRTSDPASPATGAMWLRTDL